VLDLNGAELVKVQRFVAKPRSGRCMGRASAARARRTSVAREDFADLASATGWRLPHEVPLVGRAQAVAQELWGARRLGCRHSFMSTASRCAS
jgi:hypothetical protein